MIHHVSGAIGSGKSMYCAQVIADWIMGFKQVVTNIPLVNGWDFILSRYKCQGLGSTFTFLRSDFVRSVDFQVHVAAAYSENYRYFWDIHEACDFALKQGSGLEGSRLFIFDEAQLFINARSWKDRSRVILEFMTQSRKLGYEVYLISQEKDAVDRQVRNLAEYSYTLKNLGNVRPLGIKIFPNVGQLVKRHPSTGTFIALKYIKYTTWIGELYTSNQLFGVAQPSPVSWADGLRDKIWVSGCKARYDQGRCEFARLANSNELKVVSDAIVPFIKETGSSGGS